MVDAILSTFWEALVNTFGTVGLVIAGVVVVSLIGLWQSRR